MKKKISLFISALFMLSTLFMSFAVYAEINYYSDISGHWAQQDINYMVAKGLVKGTSSTTFEPENQITRAEFVTMLTRVLKISQSIDANSYPDVLNSWYTGYISSAYKAGLLDGLPAIEGGFAPERAISRQEMSLLMGNAMDYLGKKTEISDPNTILEKFSDVPAMAEWAKNAIARAVQAEIIKGYTETTFEPEENATRAQATVMLKRLLILETTQNK